jgi:hypothetical protein
MRAAGHRRTHVQMHIGRILTGSTCATAPRRSCSHSTITWCCRARIARHTGVCAGVTQQGERRVPRPFSEALFALVHPQPLFVPANPKLAVVPATGCACCIPGEHPPQLDKLSRPGVPARSRAWTLVLIDVDPVTVQVFHQDPGAIRTDFGFAVELDATLFQRFVLSHAIVSFDAE